MNSEEAVYTRVSHSPAVASLWMKSGILLLGWKRATVLPNCTSSRADLAQRGWLINDSSEVFDTNSSCNSVFKVCVAFLSRLVCVSVISAASLSSTATGLKAGSTMEFSSFRLFIDSVWVHNYLLNAYSMPVIRLHA